MTALLKRLKNDEAGLILSAELVIILTIAVLGMVVGLVNIQHAVLSEFADLGLAFQSLNQSYGTPSYRGCWKWWGGRTSFYSGSSFIDLFDGCGTTMGGYSTTDIAGGYGAGAYGYGLGGSNYSEVIVDPNGTGAAAGSSTGAATGTIHAPAATTPSTTTVPENRPMPQPIPQGAPVPLSQPCSNCH